MSDLNKILAFRNLMPLLDSDDKSKIATALGMSLEEIEKRLVGKDKEDEFVLILMSMNVCKSIAGFDEGISQLFTTATSDLLIELKNGKKFMLEIKHTDKEHYSISGGNLKRRVEYAHNFGLELYFAISIKGYWTLYDETYLLKNSGKITAADLIHSKLDEVLGCISYVFPKGLKIKSVYSNATFVKNGAGVHFDPYGELVSYELQYNNTRIFRIKGKNSRYLAYSIILEALQDRLSMDTQLVEQDGEYTIITEMFQNDFNAISEYKFLLAPIEHMRSDTLEAYTAHSFLEQAIDDTSILNTKIKREHISGVISSLVEKGVDIKYIHQNYVYNIKIPTKK